MLNRLNSLNSLIKFGMLFSILITVSFGWGLPSPLILEGEPLTDQQYDSSQIRLLYNGTFVKIDDAHFGSGLVEIVQTNNDTTQLLFKDVNIANGPALFVYLSTKSSFSGIGDSAGSYINLGELPALTGSFSIDIVGVTNLDEYKSVLIWCEPFEVVFTWATLNPVVLDPIPTSSSSETSSSIASTTNNGNSENTLSTSQEDIVASDKNPLPINFILIFVVLGILPLIRNKLKII